MQQTAWWEERITGALMSYWIYQHLGNLSPAGLTTDTMYQVVRELPDGGPALRAFAQAADREADGAKGTMWSFGGTSVRCVSSSSIPAAAECWPRTVDR